MRARLNPTIASHVQDRQEQLSAEPPVPAFPAAEYLARRHRLRKMMSDAQLDLLIVSSPEAICWLTGYSSRWWKTQSTSAWPPMQCVAISLHDDACLQFDSDEHAELIRRCSTAVEVILAAREDLTSMIALVTGELTARSWLGQGTRAGMEFGSAVPNRHCSEALEQALTSAGGQATDATALLRLARRRKSPAEVEKITRAAAICDAGLTALEHALAPGMTELEAWSVLVSAMARAGGEPAGIHECTVVGGVELGHAWSSTRVLKRGDYLFADPCGVVDRYHANVATTFFLGEPDPAVRRIGDIAGGAYEVLTATARDGVAVAGVSRALRDYYEDSGVWGLHGWTGGYELGISFPPDWVGEFVFTVGDDVSGDFEAGLVTNYESVIHYVMIDTIVYGENSARYLSARPHQFTILE